jgi:CRP/FNR family transcriptional regulator, cyclic AMP receptor protein
VPKQADIVNVLEVDPELGAGLAADDFKRASEAATARVERVPRGLWDVSGYRAETMHFGLLLFDGLLTRQVTLGKRTGAEALGPGDVLRPWVGRHRRASIRSDINWVAVVNSYVAVLDADFLVRIAAWPQISAQLGNRVMLRAHWTAFHLAVCHMRRVDERLLIVLWHFGDRWGVKEDGGVRVPLPLTHQLLARVIGAERPSVTRAVQELVNRGLLTQGDGRTWTLRGDPPMQLERLRTQLAGEGRGESAS